MAEWGWLLDDLIVEKRWIFLDAYAVRMNALRGVVGAKAVADLFRRVPSLIKEGVWSAVDTLSFFIEGLKQEDAFDVLNELVGVAREKGGLHLLLLVDGLHEESVATSLAHMLDGFLNLTLDERSAEPVGVISIVKLRRAEYVRRLIPYRLTERGLVIDTTVRVA